MLTAPQILRKMYVKSQAYDAFELRFDNEEQMIWLLFALLLQAIGNKKMY